MSTNCMLIQIPGEVIRREGAKAVARYMKKEGFLVGKDWDALHWILAGGDIAADSGILGGEVVADVPHGSALAPQLVMPDEVGRHADDLASMTEARVRSRFDRDAMANDGVLRIPEVEELVPLVQQVATFYANARATGAAVLQVIY